MKFRNLLCGSLIVCSVYGCGGSDDGGSQQSPVGENSGYTPKNADYPITDHQLRRYQVSDIIEYNYNYDSTYFDGSGSYINDERLTWSIEDDPNEFSFEDNGRSLLAKFYTEENSFVKLSIVEQFYQITQSDNINRINEIILYNDYDGVMVDALFGSPNRLTCVAYTPEDKTCYGAIQVPGTFIVGTSYSYEGHSARIGIDPSKNYTSKISWNIAAKEIIDTAIGSFEAYKLVFSRDLTNVSQDTRDEARATYWYYPPIGVIKADIVKKEVFKETGTYQTILIDYSITNTNIPF
ncbi:hypothetical protein L3081_09310 [Colwellia sp. MSW7]|uniref:Uncharacterized protein n=1 Tax=Colwellia maritima TaxID=2912588 RepID=A0ABS9WZX5_9GAMM|nr:hypothetical protein [Colwellia maritima]MCI2283551.1 hypothetical protein [Colwellia maritima]